ncbi:hypothetical protein FRACYDRAFT_248263 [Fragilariopsis cylindrus CCMP1102]|uniref:Uncharacterized protein n=1 Tax=Fragilariopsis cylindrus CCMP1102 TaxID=635003 RepID=A0A1E7EUD9_9STRA|nr:hypothetical protein FRACYDRAFT_248263 [Fragilariopsis cylindrus CCMP1102]|eukprot:OEU09414.1 hypothetical protein FRACYDRAFT_248263 [Fragilariopsis cylindrus CCMP1102]
MNGRWSCENLLAPNATVCSNGARIAKLQFQVTSNKCGDTEFCEDYRHEMIPDQISWEYWVLSDYGALKLVQYETIENSGSFASNIDSANITSAFTDLQEFSTNTILVGPRDELVLSSETATLNLTSGTTFDFSLLISGVSDSTGQQICSSYALYSSAF